jgi:putative Ca2+/H+ antiporter (TMEM165/GDT1 family)
MGCFLAILAIIVRGLLAFRYFPKTILSGIGVGAVVGLILAIVKGDWFQLLYGLGWGFLGGVVFELVVVWIDRIDNWRRSRK